MATWRTRVLGVFGLCRNVISARIAFHIYLTASVTATHIDITAHFSPKNTKEVHYQEAHISNTTYVLITFKIESTNYPIPIMKMDLSQYCLHHVLR